MRTNQRSLLLFGAGGGYSAYLTKMLALRSDIRIATFPLNEGSGTTITELTDATKNGTYTGVTWDGTTFLTGDPVPYFDGTNDYGDLFTASLASAFNMKQGSALWWVKQDWSEAVARRMIHWLSDSGQYGYAQKRNTANTMHCGYDSGFSIVFGPLNPPGDWACVCITWDDTDGAGELLLYVNGVEEGSDAAEGTITGSLSAIVIGSITPPVSNPYKGHMSHCFLYNDVLAPADVVIGSTYP